MSVHPESFLNRWLHLLLQSMPGYVLDFPPVEKSKILHIDDLAFSVSKISVEMATVSEYVYSSIFHGVL
jgi:hypothetical protein